MKGIFQIYLYSIFTVWLMTHSVHAQERLVLTNDELRLEWEKTKVGYQLVHGAVMKGNELIELNNPLGEYTIIYSRDQPNGEPLLGEVGEKAASFPDAMYGHIFNRWKASLSAVPLQVAGTDVNFYPSHVIQEEADQITFARKMEQAELKATWSFHHRYKNDVLVEIILTANKTGYFSIASPTLAVIPEEELSWGMIPGQFQGSSLESDLILAYGYGQGIPDRPVMLRERATSTLSPLISNKQGLTLAVIPEPGQGRDPWKTNKNTQSEWRIGLSLMNRKSELSPTVFHPVLGEDESYMKKGETRTFRFRYTLQAANWYDVYKHAIDDVYHFNDILALKDTKESLSNRVLAISHYLKDDSTSMWNIQPYGKLNIGAQDYLSSVYDADGDAMKNSDYGAMWMLANITNDSILKTRLPYARDFKLAQQQEDPGFFQGSALGQYYLWKSKRFVEEWGNYVEPIALTYYVMLDIGNILLFNPDDALLRERLRLGAERLLAWQHADGHWEVAYDRKTEKPVFTDLKDLRPTFYGLLVAYRILGDEKYLQAARKGADWFIENAVNKGKFLGVCGDFRFVPDFATGQSVQALLDLYDITENETYKEAAIETARIYTASIYTHPIPGRSEKTVKGVERQDWEISQVGSRFEQGGLLGSANGNGPILLASHAGMFVRLFGLTQDSLYINMARAAVWGQDAFVDPSTHVASYYWNKMNAGVGRYPHHAWWQVGWITDYLLSEIELRSDGKIRFPRGFITPKVGPHQTYGFSSGVVFDQPSDLILSDGMLSIDNPRVDYFCAINRRDKKLYLMLLNNSDKDLNAQLDIDFDALLEKDPVHPLSMASIDIKNREELDMANQQSIQIEPYGMKVIEVAYK